MEKMAPSFSGEGPQPRAAQVFHPRFSVSSSDGVRAHGADQVTRHVCWHQGCGVAK